MKTEITKGRYTVTIRSNNDDFLALITRDGECLPGIPSRSYTTLKKAKTGANNLFKKAGA